jgi:hypothetical protein
MTHATDERIDAGGSWPPLPLEQWRPTCETLHRWTQVVGKTRLGLAPFENHWWHATLHVTARGLGTGTMPYGSGLVEIEFDFPGSELTARTSAGDRRSLRLEQRSVADFYREYRAMLATLGVEVHIVPTPNELADATPFAEDHAHATYDADAARRWWQALSQADRLLKRFRSGFAGKCSPAHFFWGSFDHACTRFSGRAAPPYQGSAPNTPDYVMREAYSHECSSAGWWPGTPGGPVAEPAFYAYTYPEPAGCGAAEIRPAEAYYHAALREWILPYDAVRTAPDPDAMVLAFFESTYIAGATLAGWDTDALRSSRDATWQGAAGTRDTPRRPS